MTLGSAGKSTIEIFERQVCLNVSYKNLVTSKQTKRRSQELRECAGGRISTQANLFLKTN